MRQSLAVWIALACAVSSAWAAKRPFNIHDDLLAYPQYQVIYPDEYILDAQAEELLQTHARSKADESNNNPQVYMDNEHADVTARDSDGPIQSTYAYEEMILDDRRFICQIPLVANDNFNTTASKEAEEADEQKELARATDRGLELLREMEGRCMYYFSGWWSYSFCYRQQIKQFHALPAGLGTPQYPPIEDPMTHSFVLGRFSAGSEADGKEDQAQKPATGTDVAELHTKGGSRYLVQHLRGGTKCDLTGRDRRVEVQFHCHPQSTDQIGWIKELTTCSYLMVIYTARLCDDVAFLPPQKDEIHNIECREIIVPDDVSEWEAAREWYVAHELAAAATAAAQPDIQIKPDGQIIGGIEVGGHKLVGMEGKKIEQGRVASVGEERVEVVLKREKGKVRQMSKQSLKKYEIDPEKVEEMRKQLEELVDEKDYQLEVVETDGIIKFQGRILDEDDELDSIPPLQQKGEEKPPKESASKDSAQEPTSGDSSAPDKPANSDLGGDSEGSEETFKDEL
ncbi:hypothetical protein N7495_004583 [Penicillium taxi]|uniref:uncharacterized protein n=1 Tax=Penicillium taxi TaxID=168475 RepID=UPI002545B587|nr:uncharacterized protein N7495_004583 [Penicillium taxi]KAJ5899839.1 hypothetical protein N7495_004583 [Penicillium taxi]